MRTLLPPQASILCLLAVASACTNEQGISELKFERIAVATGDFDYMEEPLLRLDVAHDAYEGFISTAVYDEDIDPDGIVLKTEELFTAIDETEAEPLLYSYDALLLNSGTRGFGEYVYNGVDTDDAFLTDADALANIEGFVGRGRTLVVSDWGYDVVEALYPDRVSFLNDDTGEFDAAQAGTSTQITATVRNEDVAAELGADQLVLEYDFSYWTVITDVADDVEVLLSGDVEYRISAEEGTGTLTDVPLLIAFDEGGGRVVFSTFHWRAQPPTVTDALLQAVVEGLDPGNADSVESVPVESR